MLLPLPPGEAAVRCCARRVRGGPIVGVVAYRGGHVKNNGPGVSLAIPRNFSLRARWLVRPPQSPAGPPGPKAEALGYPGPLTTRRATHPARAEHARSAGRHRARSPAEQRSPTSPMGPPLTRRALSRPAASPGGRGKSLHSGPARACTLGSSESLHSRVQREPALSGPARACTLGSSESDRPSRDSAINREASRGEGGCARGPLVLSGGSEGTLSTGTFSIGRTR
jgi:hypothetical protein